MLRPRGGRVEGFVTITGGKATTLRGMAETTADLVCAKLGVQAPCLTRTTPTAAPHRLLPARGGAMSGQGTVLLRVFT